MSPGPPASAPSLPPPAEISHFEHLERWAAPIRALARWPSHQELNELLGHDAGVRFVPSPKRGRANRKDRPLYDDAIVLHGLVATRLENHHDLMNALVWAAFPKSKKLIHSIQRDLIQDARARAIGRRSAEHDALAMVDEGGVLLIGSSHVLFGHALYEHLATQGGPVFGVGLSVELTDPSHLDDAFASLLAESGHSLRHSDSPRVHIDRRGSIEVRDKEP